ncbi:MAG TPA: hypothetical protein VKT80_13360 [Chloroflexota bacterium]|nr:hypothetical protein [Chloroflexota bacterium]
MPQLTDELRREVRAAGDTPLRLTDPETLREYVLVRADVFDRLRGFLYDDGEYDPRVGAALMNEIMAEDDKDDPYLESYQNYQSGTP